MLSSSASSDVCDGCHLCATPNLNVAHIHSRIPVIEQCVILVLPRSLNAIFFLPLRLPPPAPQTPPQQTVKQWLDAVNRSVFNQQKSPSLPTLPSASLQHTLFAFDCASIHSVPLRCHHYEHPLRLQRHLGARAAACSSAARHQLRHRVAGRGRARVPQERRLRDTMSERPQSRLGLPWRRRRRSGERRGRLVPRVPRVDAAAACARVAGVQRGWLLRGLRRVRSVRRLACLLTQSCRSNRR